MTTKQPAASGESGEQIEMFKNALKCVTGQLDFGKLATLQGVANAEAMRKRFKRIFEKDEEGLIIKGNAVGAGAETQTTAKTPAKTPRTPKGKDHTVEDDGSASPTKKAPASKKRNSAANGAEEKKNSEEDAAPIKKAKTPRKAKTPKKVEESEEDEVEATRVGSPAVQAKTDAVVKEIEMNGVEVNSPAKQAIHDGIEKDN